MVGRGDRRLLHRPRRQRSAARLRHCLCNAGAAPASRNPWRTRSAAAHLIQNTKKIFNRGNKRPRGPISFLHAALASGSPGMIEFGPRRGPLRRIMRKVIVGVAAVRLRLWLCLWVWLDDRFHEICAHGTGWLLADSSFAVR